MPSNAGKKKPGGGGNQAKTKTQAPKRITENRKRKQKRLMNRVKKMITEQNWWKGDLPEEVFQEALATAETEKWGRRVQVVVKNKELTSADAASSTSVDAASSSPSAVPPPRFKVEITWSDDKVGDGDRWFV